MEPTFVTINAVGKARRVTENGRDYLVVPMTSIVEGVLPGSKGRLFYPAEEISRNVAQWDGTDIVVYHPTDRATGRPLAVSDPSVADRVRAEFGTGFLRNSRVKTTNGPVRLQHDGWFDVELLKAHDARLTATGKPAVMPRLLNHEPVELSTGLFTENTPVANGAAHNGVPYDFVARNYRRDHLAVLPDQTGACSVRDGCGVLVDNTASGYGPGKNPNSHRAHKATEKADKTGDRHDHKAAFEAHDKARSDTITTDQVASKYHYQMADFHNRKFLGKKASRPSKPTINTDGSNPKCTLNSEGVCLNCGGKGGTRGPCSTGEPTSSGQKSFSNASRRAYKSSADATSASSKAGKTAGTPEHEAAYHGHLKAMVDHDTAHGVAEMVGMPQEGKIHKTQSEHHNLKAEYHEKQLSSLRSKQTINHSEEPDVNKQTLVTWLTTNCKHWAGKDKILNDLDEATLAGLKTDAEALVTANAALADANKKLVTNCEGPKSLTDMLKAATPQEQATWNTAVKIEQRERTRLIGMLTANTTDATKKATAAKRFEAMETEALSDLVDAMPPVTNKDDPRHPFNTPAPIYAAGVFPAGPSIPVNNYDGTKSPLKPFNDDGSVPLDNPVLNWKKKQAAVGVA